MVSTPVGVASRPKAGTREKNTGVSSKVLCGHRRESTKQPIGPPTVALPQAWTMPSGTGAEKGPRGLLGHANQRYDLHQILGPCPEGSTALRAASFNVVGNRPLDRRDQLLYRHPPFATNFEPTRTNRPLSGRSPGGSRQSTRFAFST